MNWKNSSFQVAAFIVGKCHTADEARRTLLLLRGERAAALEHSEVTKLRTQARLMKIDAALANGISDWERVEAEAGRREIEYGNARSSTMIDEANREIVFIDRLLAVIEPYRKYRELPDHEAFQAVQREEWLLELASRAQTYIICAGSIPVEHFNAMRVHPDWESHLAPTINRMVEASKSGRVIAALGQPPDFVQAIKDHLLGPAPNAAVLHLLG